MRGNEGSPRTLAVLYTDQVGSTAMLQAFGDRAYDDVRRSIETAIHGAANRARGTVVKMTGDGGLLVFESAADAIDAAIALQTEIALLPSRPQGRVQMRVGLAVGDVTVERR